MKCLSLQCARLGTEHLRPRPYPARVDDGVAWGECEAVRRPELAVIRERQFDPVAALFASALAAKLPQLRESRGPVELGRDRRDAVVHGSKHTR